MTRGGRLDVDAVIGGVLLVGTVASVTLVTAGLAWHWVTHGDFSFDYTIAATTVRDFLAADLTQVVGATRPRALVNLGLGVLLLTPYVRVLASLVYFATIAHDWKYTAFTGFVFATLTWALVR